MKQLQDIKDVLKFYQLLGFDRLPVRLIPVTRLNVKTVQKTKPVINKTIEDKKSSGRELELIELRNEIGDCRKCKLSNKRLNIVFGEGSPDARLMFIGEAPGREEDEQGRPFVGEAGMVLTRMIEKMGFKREEVYIANIVKCRPPLNRDPEPDEIEACRQYVEKQIEIIKPAVIMSLGRISAMTLTGNMKLKITAIRGKFFYFKDIPVMPTFHPAYLMRNPKDKWLTWNDAQKVLERLNEQ